ncbi:MAG: hypothetical protein ACE5J7_03495 [Candidatus Aenigmatarchaeota archaeon]
MDRDPLSSYLNIREATRHIIDYLIMYPDACGEEGAEDYNWHPEFGQKHGKITGKRLNRVRHTYRERLGLGKKRPKRGPGKTAMRIKRFLRLYPDAFGEEGTRLYNNHPNFGKFHGKIKKYQLENARHMFMKELGLKDMRGKSRKKNSVEERIKSMERFFKKFPNALGQPGLNIYNNHPEYGKKHGKLTKDQMRYARDVLRKRKKVKNKKWSGSITRKKVKEYLRLHPDAVGKRGAKAYNNDPDFGKKYGRITPDYLNGIRWDYGKELGLLDMRGKYHDEAALHILEFLGLYPEAAGESGAYLFNEHPDFGKRYGTITKAQMDSGRGRYRKRIGNLPDMRAKPRRKRKRKIAPWFKRERAKYFIMENMHIDNPKDMRKAVKEKLGYTYTKREIKELMKECEELMGEPDI